MYIKELHLQNFKRFTDLKINLSESPEPYKLVLLIGANGSRKSSVFDAFEALAMFSKNHGRNLDDYLTEYYKKKHDHEFKKHDHEFNVSVLFEDGTHVTRTDNTSNNLYNLPLNALYGRSSLRQLPRLTRTTLGQQTLDIKNDIDRPKIYIERDKRFENDLEEITKKIFKDFYKTDKEKREIISNYIDPINEAFQRIFGDNEATMLKLISIIPPLDGKVAEIQFQKGNSEIHYDLLSSGEKEIFNILINLLSRRGYYQDTVYFFDEIDLHLNTKLQYRLLQEITEHWIPENCQLWTASHSLGFIDYANDYEKAAIIDFDDLDFDVPQVLYPQPKNKFDVFEIAVSQEFLAKLFEGKSIIFAENTDAPYYNNLKLKDIIFFTAIDKNDVFYKSKNTNYLGIIDRDFLTDEEVKLIREKYSNLHILDLYSIENYFYHPENLEEYFKSIGKEFNKDNYIQNLVAEKNAKREDIIFGLQGARSSYPFFLENENAKLLKEFKSNAKKVMEILQSDTFEVFYKVFPAKDYGKTIRERQNLNKETLAQTNWFRKSIEKIIFS